MRIVELRGITITILNKCTYQADTIDVYAYTEKNTITENRNEHVQPHQSLSKRRWRKRGIQPMKEKEYDILWVIEKVIKNRDNPPPARKNKQKARKECNVIPGRSFKGQIQLGMTMNRGNDIEKGKHRNDYPRPYDIHITTGFLYWFRSITVLRCWWGRLRSQICLITATVFWWRRLLSQIVWVLADFNNEFTDLHCSGLNEWMEPLPLFESISVSG